MVGDSGDDRLSRQGHYHGPGGLNGRVRDGNGCGPAGVVAGKTPGGRSSPPGGSRGRLVTPGLAGPGADRSVASRVGRGTFSESPRRGAVPGLSGQGPSAASISGERVVSHPGSGPAGPRARAPGRGGQAVGCWDWSAAAVARRTLPAHRPGRLPGAFARYTCRKPRLEEGFALRCLQRLSFPDLATRRCPERDSRHTRGRSSPILSY